MEHFIAAFLVCRSAVRYGLRAWTWDTSQSVQSLLHCTELQERTGTIYHYTQGCSLTQFCVLFMCRAVLFKLFISWKEWMLNVSWYVEHRGHFGCNTQSQNLSHLSQCNCLFYSTLYLSCKLDEDHFRTKILYFHFLSWMYVRSRLAVSGLCVCVPSVEERAGLWFAASGAGRAGWRETSRVRRETSGAQRETALSLRRMAHPEQHTHDERTRSGASGLPAGPQQRGNPTA